MRRGKRAERLDWGNVRLGSSAPSATGKWSENPAEQEAFEVGRSLGRQDVKTDVIAMLCILGNPAVALFVWALLGGLLEDKVLGGSLDPLTTAAVAVIVYSIALGFLVHRRWR